jgi:hypothetical protein
MADPLFDAVSHMPLAGASGPLTNSEACCRCGDVGNTCLCRFKSIRVTIAGAMPPPWLNRCITGPNIIAQKLSGTMPTSAEFVPTGNNCTLPTSVRGADLTLDTYSMVFEFEPIPTRPWSADFTVCPPTATKPYHNDHSSLTLQTSIGLQFGGGPDGLSIGVTSGGGGAALFEGSIAADDLDRFCCNPSYTVVGRTFEEDVTIVDAIGEDASGLHGFTTSHTEHWTWGGGTATVELISDGPIGTGPCCKTCCKSITTDLTYTALGTVYSVSAQLNFGCLWLGTLSFFTTAPGVTPKEFRTISSRVYRDGGLWVWEIIDVLTREGTGVLSTTKSLYHTAAIAGQTCPPLPSRWSGTFNATCGDAAPPCPVSLVDCSVNIVATIGGGTGSGAAQSGGYNGDWLMEQNTDSDAYEGGDGGREFKLLCSGNEWIFRAFAAGSDPDSGAPYLEWRAPNPPGSCPTDVTDWGTSTNHNGMTGAAATLNVAPF